jgi:probable phosphoglycerate mutase
MSVDLWLARHGATAWSREDRFCGRSNIPLSDEGRIQAVSMGTYLAKLPIAAVYCSPLQRSLQTATAVASKHGLVPQTATDLREMDFGSWEGRTRTAIVAEEAMLYSAWQRDPVYTTPPGGESAMAVAERVSAVLTTICARHEGQTILIVAHKTVNRILICQVLGLPIVTYRERLAQDVACLNRMRIGSAVSAQLQLLNARVDQ